MPILQHLRKIFRPESVCKISLIFVFLQHKETQVIFDRNAMDELDKKFYKISEVAELLHIPASTLRFWESRFTVIKPRRSKTGIRFYTAADIEKISMIHYLVKDCGLKLDAAQEQIRSNPKGIERRHKTVQRLLAMRSSIEQMLDALHSLR